MGRGRRFGRWRISAKEASLHPSSTRRCTSVTLDSIKKETLSRCRRQTQRLILIARSARSSGSCLHLPVKGRVDGVQVMNFIRHHWGCGECGQPEGLSKGLGQARHCPQPAYRRWRGDPGRSSSPQAHRTYRVRGGAALKDHRSGEGARGGRGLILIDEVARVRTPPSRVSLPPVPGSLHGGAAGQLGGQAAIACSCARCSDGLKSASSRARANMMRNKAHILATTAFLGGLPPSTSRSRRAFSAPTRAFKATM